MLSKRVSDRLVQTLRGRFLVNEITVFLIYLGRTNIFHIIYKYYYNEDTTIISEEMDAKYAIIK